MSYSIGLRLRVVNHVRPRGQKIEASRIYQVRWWSVNDWCQRADLSSRSPPVGPGLVGIRARYTSTQINFWLNLLTN